MNKNNTRDNSCKQTFSHPVCSLKRESHAVEFYSTNSHHKNMAVAKKAAKKVVKKAVKKVAKKVVKKAVKKVAKKAAPRKAVKKAAKKAPAKKK
ncbi:MAG: hypothetical protein RLZZ70_741 [Candidatus Parcubacteria bacterium]